MPITNLNASSSVTPIDTGLQEQLGRLESQFDVLQRQMRQLQKMASIGASAAMLAHEFNNLFTPVVSYARYALDKSDTELMVKALQITLSHTEIVGAMASRILGLASNEAQKLEPVNVAKLVEDSVACLCRDLEKDKISLSMEVDPSLYVRGDANQLMQVFFNLVVNARQAMLPNPGRLSFKAEPQGEDWVAIHVTDTGCGIRPEHLDSIFEPFFTTKSQSGKADRRGTGLGLNVCRDIVEEHQGRLTVQSEANKGTTFTVELPASIPPASSG